MIIEYKLVPSGILQKEAVYFVIWDLYKRIEYIV